MLKKRINYKNSHLDGMNNLKLLPKISIITPNYNGSNYIENTIQSVLDQKYPNLEYIIIDGGSTDGSIDIINNYKDQLFYWVSEPDDGMYDAINKGFSKSTGDIMYWINSDDILWEGALNYVASVFSQNPNINWIQGHPSVINEQGILVYNREQVFSKYYFYLYKYEQSFRFIQQESTFWTRTLWEKTGGFLNTEFTLASDFDLWMRFFKYDTMYCTKKQLGAFRIRKGQKSSNMSLYLTEAKRSLRKNFKRLAPLDKLSIHLLKVLINLSKISKIGFFKKVMNKIADAYIGKSKLINTTEPNTILNDS